MKNGNILNQDSQILEENRRLKRAVEELSVLNEIATAITSTQPLEEIVNLIVLKCVKHIKVEEAAVMLLNEKDLNKPFYTLIRRQDSVSHSLPYRMDAQLTGWMLKNKKPIIINDFLNDPGFKISHDDKVILRSLLSVPMIVKGKMIGLLTVINKRSSEGFNKDDERLLGIIAVQSSQVIENARLYQEEQTLLRLHEEMRLAYEIQNDLLPKNNPEFTGYSAAGKTIPAKFVGGDYFDFIPVGKNKLVFCVGDISGKGIPAAILMANLQATLKGQTLLGQSVKNSVSFANNILFYNSSPEKFASLFCGIIDNSKNELIYCNAGHNYPFFISDEKQIARLPGSGPIIGLQADSVYEEISIKINPGDLLLLFSDGITEALNSKDEEFGEEKLAEIILKNYMEKPENLIRIIIEEVNNFSKNRGQNDDMTLLAIKRDK